eukprot:TRINITY_DN2760_c0_g2_i2.p1 TRINITY_DN2760_c0_g2~~TRINITY_DN2760_c0_g2_i2.p1  ORF type:complete len:179 (+),score=40.01 TRINITY_DN2760_c0_g2_i2:48-539(+)
MCIRDRSNTKEDSKASSNNTSRKKLLLVDDNYSNLFVLQSYLRPLKISADEVRFLVITQALNGRDAVDRILEKSKKGSSDAYKLVLMDINMPVMGGIEAAGILREKMRDEAIEEIPLVALSAETKTEEEKSEFCKSTGFSEFVTKPITKDDFTKLLMRNNVVF